MNYIKIYDESKTVYDEQTKSFFTPLTPCPFNVRDLSKDECYSGNGKNRCKYFIRYDWNKHYGHVVCSCNLPVINNKQIKQQEFNFD